MREEDACLRLCNTPLNAAKRLRMPQVRENPDEEDEVSEADSSSSESGSDDERDAEERKQVRLHLCFVYRVSAWTCAANCYSVRHCHRLTNHMPGTLPPATANPHALPLHTQPWPSITIGRPGRQGQGQAADHGPQGDHLRDGGAQDEGDRHGQVEEADGGGRAGRRRGRA
mgnify:CR=1 FL=1